MAEGVAMRWAMVSHSEYVAVAGVAAGVPWSAAVDGDTAGAAG